MQSRLFLNLKFEKLSENKFFGKTVFDSSQKVWMGLIYERIFFNSQGLSPKAKLFQHQHWKKSNLLDTVSGPSKWDSDVYLQSLTLGTTR